MHMQDDFLLRESGSKIRYQEGSVMDMDYFRIDFL